MSCVRFGQMERGSYEARETWQRCALADQVEYYFSEQNLRNDRHLQRLIASDPRKQGYVSLYALLTFPRIQAQTNSVALLSRALSSSAKLELSSDGEWVKGSTPKHDGNVNMDLGPSPSDCTLAWWKGRESDEWDRVVGEIGALCWAGDSFFALLIGSRALDYHCQRQHQRMPRDPQDWDLICSASYVWHWLSHNRAALLECKLGRRLGDLKVCSRLRNGQQVELRIVEYEKTGRFLAELVRWFERFGNPAEAFEGSLFPTASVAVAPLSLLLTLKRAHVWWPIHWVKTVEDLLFFQHAFPSIQPVQDLLVTYRRELEKEWAHPALNWQQSNQAFFAQSERKLERVIDHDQLHRYVSLALRKSDDPMFRRFKRDRSKAPIDRQLFAEGSLEHKRVLVQEEVITIALERFLLPARTNPAITGLSDSSLVSQRAYLAAYEKVCTRLSSGAFREFAIQQYSALKFVPLNLVALQDQIRREINPATDSSSSEPSGDVYAMNQRFRWIEDTYFRPSHYVLRAVWLPERVLLLLERFTDRPDLPFQATAYEKPTEVVVWSQSDES